MNRHHTKLVHVEYPRIEMAGAPPAVTAEELRTRIDALVERLEARGFTHAVVYGDREHFANIAYLSGYDPRFEEALLIIRSEVPPLLLVGNEGEAYTAVSPLVTQGAIRTEKYCSFSLLDQPRPAGRSIRAILADEGIGQDSTVATIGWKYFSAEEEPAGRHALEIPAYIADALRGLADPENVLNATEMLMSARDGLRSISTPREIAMFEYYNQLASAGMRSVLSHVRPGIIDYELASHVGYNGSPMGCHMTLPTGPNCSLGLAGPSGRVLSRGEPLASNICYWGANSCRAGWIAESAEDLPLEAQSYADEFVAPYFVAMQEWLSMIEPGVEGGAIYARMSELLPYSKYGVSLNPGHLIHLDEWLSSPIYADSTVPLRSGMVMQIDVIPVSDRYFSTRMEDGIVVADENLRQQIRAQFPETYNRMAQRRDFMENTLGFELPESVLPLSDIPGIIPPFLLDPNRVFVFD